MRIGKVIGKSLVILVALAALVLLLAYMSDAFKTKVEPGTVEAGVRTVPPGAETWEVHKVIDMEKAEFVGTLRAERRTEVSSRIMASIIELNARAGAEVKEGDLLAQLDDRDLRDGLGQAEQAVLAAEANLADAKSSYERMQKLVEQKVAPQQEYDRAEATFKIARANLSKAREATSAARTMLSYAEIRAPVSGIIIDKLADEGDTATPGRPLLAIYDPTLLRLEAAVPEAVSGGIKVGDYLQVRVDALDLAEPLHGTVEEIVPQAQAASRSVLVKVRVPDVEGLVEGMFGRLIVPTQERVRLCLAQSAVREVGQLRFVDVVSEGGGLQRRQVKLSAHERMGRVEVLSGVDAGEKVVLYGSPPQPLPDDVQLFGEGERGQ